ncbi:hypothetical protein MASR2M48_09070 [Spirochaetota bacterium]
MVDVRKRFAGRVGTSLLVVVAIMAVVMVVGTPGYRLRKQRKTLE